MATNLPVAVGDEVQAEDINRYSGIHADLAGATINGATTPVACYKDNSDDEWYACDGNDDTKLEFSGFAISNGTDGNAIKIQQHGVVSGFTGLTEGAKYYVDDTGALSTTIGTYEIFVGVAISTTQIFMEAGLDSHMQYVGSASDTADVITVPAAARFAWVKVSAVNSSSSRTAQHTMFVARKGMTTNNFNDIDIGGAGANDTGASISWSGSSITISASGDTTSVSGTAFFYR